MNFRCIPILLGVVLLGSTLFLLEGCGGGGPIGGITLPPPEKKFIPPGLTSEQQAKLVAEQALSAGREGLLSERQLGPLAKYLEELGEPPPPSPEARAFSLFLPLNPSETPRIDKTLDGIHFTGLVQVKEGTSLVETQLQATSQNFLLTMAQTVSQNPDDFTYQLRIQGKLLTQGKVYQYDVDINLDKSGSGQAFYKVRSETPGDQSAYEAQIEVSNQGKTLRGREKITRSDGFWTRTLFTLLLGDTRPIVYGTYNFEASNDFIGQFLVREDQTGEGAIQDRQGKVIATLKVDEQGHLVILYPSTGLSESLSL